ncbi:hypothetical protein ES704_02011 [subsurface metagenome]
MNRPPLKELIRRVKDKPETTILLLPAIRSGESTVNTFYFTPSIQEYFEEIFERVATGRGGGFWIQAEFGAGKTHFLATLSCLLTNVSKDFWDPLNNDEIKKYWKRLRNKKLFPVVISLKGEADIGGEDNLYNIVDKHIEESLEEKHLLEKCTITATDELIEWYESSGLKKEIDLFIRERTSTAQERQNKDSLAKFIREYCKRERIRPDIPGTTKERFYHIYRQIITQGYTGLLFIIDEFECWQAKHPRGSREYAIDEEVLETLAWELPRGKGLEIYTIVASQQPVPTKLLGERYKNFLLLADKYERDYDEIVSYRVRDLINEKQPEIEHYYEYYYKEFKFLKNVSKEYFLRIFPFQPRCFEAIRLITRRGLPTARAGIGVLWQTLEETILSRDSLVTLNDLMISSDLIDDLNIQEYKASYEAYKVAIDSLPDYFDPDEKEEKEIAERIIKTLFLWHIAYLETPRYLSEVDLTEAALTTGEIVKGEDETRLILSKIRDLPQVEYTKEKGAIFKVAEKGVIGPNQIFTNLKKKLTDPSQIQRHWENGLKLSLQETGGQESLFGDYEFETTKSYEVDYKKIEYPGKVILARNWRSDYGERIRENLHFRVVFLTKQVEFDLKEIEDSRIAIYIPSELTNAACEEARNYWTLQEMQEQYKDKSGSEAEEVREWLVGKKRDIIRNLLNKQISLYGSGKILTARQVGMDLKKVFATNRMEGIVKGIVPYLLADTYRNCPINSNTFGKHFKSNDAKKVFDGLFKGIGGASTSACENFAPALGLSEIEKPQKFNPQESKVFEIITEKFKENNEELPLWKLYDELQNKYGLTKEIVTLYCFCFVARGRPLVEITLKPMNRLGLKENKITHVNLRQVEWRARFDEDFDTLSRSTAESWNDVVSIARIVNPNLRTATTHEEIQAQESLLLQSLEGIRKKNVAIQDNLKLLSTRFNEEIEEEKFVTLEHIGRIAESQNFSEFYHHFKGEEKAEEKFKNEFEELKKLSAVAEQSAELLGIKTYLTDVSLSEKDKLVLEKMIIVKQLKLNSLLSNPSRIGSLRESFEKFKDSFQRQYQIHHRDYYKGLKKLHNKLEDKEIKIDVLKKLTKIPELGEMVEEKMEAQYHELLSKTKLCPASDPVRIETNPYCPDCPSRLNLTMTVPEDEVEDFVHKVDKALDSRKRNLSQLLTERILAEDKGNRLDKLLKAIRASELDRFVIALSDDLIEHLRKCISKANIVTTSRPILSKLLERFSIVDDENLEEVVRAFREELEKALEDLKKKNPKKKVKIYLR